jgi:hypothetical protein
MSFLGKQNQCKDIVVEKICNKCKIKKPSTEFYKKLDGLSSMCKKCIGEQKKEYNKRNKERIREYQKQYREENKDKAKEYQKQYREENKDKAKEYYKKNREKKLVRVKRWQQKVKDDPYRKFKNRIKSNMRYHIKKNGERTFELLGYTREEFLNRMKETLPKEYAWEDFLSNTRAFHIDHIIQQNLYDNEKEYIEKCWNLRNLRLLPAKENISRLNKKINMKLVEEYEIMDLLPKSVGKIK